MAHFLGLALCHSQPGGVHRVRSSQPSWVLGCQRPEPNLGFHICDKGKAAPQTPAESLVQGGALEKLRLPQPWKQSLCPVCPNSLCGAFKMSGACASAKCPMHTEECLHVCGPLWVSEQGWGGPRLGSGKAPIL